MGKHLVAPPYLGAFCPLADHYFKKIVLIGVWLLSNVVFLLYNKMNQIYTYVYINIALP